MMTDTYDLSELESIGDLMKRVPGRPSAVTGWRWVTHGCGGIKLRSVLIGSKRFSCERWLREFFAARTAAKDGWPETLPTCRQRERQIQAAEQSLEREGL